MNADTCVFCRILAGKAEASFLFRDERVAVFINLVPVNPGHLLVVPTLHAVASPTSTRQTALGWLRSRRTWLQPCAGPV